MVDPVLNDRRFTMNQKTTIERTTDPIGPSDKGA